MPGSMRSMSVGALMLTNALWRKADLSSPGTQYRSRTCELCHRGYAAERLLLEVGIGVKLRAAL